MLKHTMMQTVYFLLQMKKLSKQSAIFRHHFQFKRQLGCKELSNLHMDSPNIGLHLCANCHKIVNADIDWIIHCPSCKQQSEVELRARIPIIITDASCSIHCIISREDAEKLIEFTPLQLKQAQEDGFEIDTELRVNGPKGH
ncbi:uncharacterized protein [Coffea arabica]|uniref:Uncharacterized protein isoform X1 n=1 Tax=Coffea arabica TaxID=13443 RepID=A0ABM4X632_COFAR